MQQAVCPIGRPQNASLHLMPLSRFQPGVSLQVPLLALQQPESGQAACPGAEAEGAIQELEPSFLMPLLIDQLTKLLGQK